MLVFVIVLEEERMPVIRQVPDTDACVYCGHDEKECARGTEEACRWRARRRAKAAVHEAASNSSIANPLIPRVEEY